MRVYFHTGYGENIHVDYPVALVRHLCRSYGVTVAETSAESDVTAVSCCDIMDIGLLKSARKLGKPIIAGGFISMLPIMRAWADVVCVGEAYAFVRAMATARTIDDLAILPNAGVYQGRRPQVDEWIDWSMNPVVQQSPKAYYYYCGKGCPIKCKFCLLSYSRHLQDAPEVYIRRALSSIPKSARLYLMTSYYRYDLTPKEQSRLGVIDVTIKEYLGGGHRGLRRVRCGIEFWTEALRRELAKPLSAEQIGAFFAMTGEAKAEVIAYVIAGLEPMESLREVAEALPHGGALHPRFTFAPTLFDPQPFTPLHDFDIRQRYPFDHKAAMRILLARNRRVRVHQPAKPSHASWRTIMQRCQTREEAGFCWKLRTCDNNDILLRTVEAEQPHLLGTASLADIRARRRKFDPELWGEDGARSSEPIRLGMPPS